MSQERDTTDLERLASALEILTLRVAALEKGMAERVYLRPSQAPAPNPDHLETQAAGEGASGLFTKAALICGVMIGAMVLRLITQRGVMGALPGAFVGISYAVILVLLPALQRKTPFLKVHGAMLQYAGLLLAPLVLLETYHRAGAIDAGVTACALAGVGILAGIVGTWRNQRYLVAMAMGGMVFAIGGIGFTTDAMVTRFAALVVLSGACTLIAGKGDWKFLMPLVYPLVAVMIAFAVITTSNREYGGVQIPGGILTLAAAFYFVVALNHMLRLSTISARVAAWLPVMTAWMLGLAIFRDAHLAGIGGAAAALVMILIAAFLAKRSGQLTAGVSGFGAAAVVGGAMGLPIVDTTGISLCVVGVIFAVVARRFHNGFWTVLAQLLIALAAAVAMTEGKLASLEAGGSILGRVALGLVICAVAFSSYVLARKRTGENEKTMPGEWSAPLSLVSGAVLLFFAVRLAAFSILGSGPGGSLAQTVFLAILCAASQILAYRLKDRAMRNLGIAAVLVLTGKALLGDLLSLGTGLAVLSLASMTVVFVVTSICFKKWTPVTTPTAIVESTSPSAGQPDHVQVIEKNIEDTTG